MTLPSFLAPPSPPFTPRSPSSLRLADTALYQSFLLPRRRRCRHRPTSPSHLATNVDSSILAAKVPPPPASPRFAGPRRPSSLPSPCAVRARALVPAHSCQRADNVLFWPAVTLPSFSLRRPPRRRRSPSPPRSVAFPVAAAPHPRQGQLPSPSPPLPVALPVAAAPRRRQGQSSSPSLPLPIAAKVSRPPRHRRSPSPPRSVALPIAAAPRRRRSPSPPLSRLRPSVKNIVRVVVKNIVLWPSQQRRGRARRGRPKRCSTTFFSKTREMRSLTRCRRRQRGLYADGAPHNGLREVDEARSSGLHASKVAG